MKVIISGNAKTQDLNILKEAIERSHWEVTEVVSGDSTSVERLGTKYAMDEGLTLTLIKAETNVFGKAAIPIRNSKMLKYSDALLIVRQGKSEDIDGLIADAREHGVPLIVFALEELRGNSIRDNPLFADQIRNNKDGKRMNTKTLTLNDVSIEVYQDPRRNSKTVQFMVELFNEIERIKDRLEDFE
jgi:hypothetical protein